MKYEYCIPTHVRHRLCFVSPAHAEYIRFASSFPLTEIYNDLRPLTERNNYLYKAQAITSYILLLFWFPISYNDNRFFFLYLLYLLLRKRFTVVTRGYFQMYYTTLHTQLFTKNRNIFVNIYTLYMI